MSVIVRFTECDLKLPRKAVQKWEHGLYAWVVTRWAGKVDALRINLELGKFYSSAEVVCCSRIAVQILKQCDVVRNLERTLRFSTNGRAIDLVKIAETWLCCAAAWVLLGLFATTIKCGGVRGEFVRAIYCIWFGLILLSTVVETLCDGILKRSLKRAMIRDLLRICMGGGDSSLCRILSK